MVLLMGLGLATFRASALPTVLSLDPGSGILTKKASLEGKVWLSARSTSVGRAM